MSSLHNIISKAFVVAGVMLLPTTISAFANFTPGKGVYSFAFEFESDVGTRGDSNTTNKQLTNHVEIDNAFGITENASIAVNFYSEKDTLLRVSDEYPYKRWIGAFQYVEAGHKVNLPISDSWESAVENLIRFYSNGGPQDTYKPMYRLHGYLKHFNKQAFFTKQVLELFYGRRFNAPADQLRTRITFGFNIAQNTTFMIQSDNFFNINKNGGDNALNDNLYMVESILYAGPTFGFKNGSAIYALLRVDVGGKAASHKKGILLGYSRDILL